MSYVELVSLLVTVGYQLAATFGLILAFCLIRPKHKAIYEPRLKYLQKKRKPPALEDSLLAWTKVYNLNDQQEAMKIGIDATLFLSIAKFLYRKLFIITGFFAFSMVLTVPLFFVHLFAPSTSLRGEILHLASMSHLNPSTEIWWVHPIFACIITLWFSLKFT